MTDTPAQRVRIDKWLWAARFFKTRTLASDAVDGGKVRLNSARIKPAKEVAAGDVIEVSIGDTRWTLIVRALSEKRGPASVAQQLYEETAESQAAREAQRTLHKAAAAPGADLHGRPTKRDRRRIERFSRGD